MEKKTIEVVVLKPVGRYRYSTWAECLNGHSFASGHTPITGGRWSVLTTVKFGRSKAAAI